MLAALLGQSVPYHFSRFRSALLPLCFRDLAGAPNKTALFHALWEKGNNQAKCYALIGLYWVKDPDADRLAQQMILSHASVATMRGCIVGTHEQAASFVDMIKSGEYLKYYFPELAASR